MGLPHHHGGRRREIQERAEREGDSQTLVTGKVEEMSVRCEKVEKIKARTEIWRDGDVAKQRRCPAT
jgi:hypothetical protein